MVIRQGSTPEHIITQMQDINLGVICMIGLWMGLQTTTLGAVNLFIMKAVILPVFLVFKIPMGIIS